LTVQISLLEKNAPRTKRFEAYIDSGASRCLFHSSIGEAIGLDINAGRIEETIGVSGKKSRIYLHDICLHAPGGPIVIHAGFSDGLPCAGLLGMDGFFQHFRVVLDPIANECQLERVHKT
jgi:hypothetical protein